MKIEHFRPYTYDKTGHYTHEGNFATADADTPTRYTLWLGIASMGRARWFENAIPERPQNSDVRMTRREYLDVLQRNGVLLDEEDRNYVTVFEAHIGQDQHYTIAEQSENQVRLRTIFARKPTNEGAQLDNYAQLVDLIGESNLDVTIVDFNYLKTRWPQLVTPIIRRGNKYRKDGEWVRTVRLGREDFYLR